MYSSSVREKGSILRGKIPGKGHFLIIQTIMDAFMLSSEPAGGKRDQTLFIKAISFVQISIELFETLKVLASQPWYVFQSGLPE